MEIICLIIKKFLHLFIIRLLLTIRLCSVTFCYYLYTISWVVQTQHSRHLLGGRPGGRTQWFLRVSQSCQECRVYAIYVISPLSTSYSRSSHYVLNSALFSNPVTSHSISKLVALSFVTSDVLNMLLASVVSARLWGFSTCLYDISKYGPYTVFVNSNLAVNRHYIFPYTISLKYSDIQLALAA